MIGHKSQRGDAMTIAVIILTVALIAAVGWIFWQNVSKTDTEQPSGETVSKKSEQPAQKEHCVEKEALCFDYPADWTVASSEDSYPAEGSQAWIDNGSKAEYIMYKSSITAPGGDLYVGIGTGVTGIGGMCMPGDLGTAHVKKVTKTSIKNTREDRGEWSTGNLSAVQVVNEREKGKFVSMAFLSDMHDLSTVGKKDGCSVAFAGLNGSRNTEGLISVAVNGGAFSSDEPFKEESYTTLDDAMKALDSKKHKQAFEILSSAHYK